MRGRLSGVEAEGSDSWRELLSCEALEVGVVEGQSLRERISKVAPKALGEIAEQHKPRALNSELGSSADVSRGRSDGVDGVRVKSELRSRS